MKLKTNEIKELLVTNNISTKEKLDEMAKIAERNNGSFLELLYDSKIISEQEFVKIYANSINVELIDLSNIQIPRDIIEKLPERTARKYQAVVFEIEGDKHYKVAMADPRDVEAIQFIQKQLGYDLSIFLATTTDIIGALETYKEGLSSEISEAIKDTEEVEIKGEEIEPDASAENVESKIAEAPIARAINILIEYAVKSRASDIHIEPRETFVHIRYRVDGVLKDTMTLPKSLNQSVVSRIKILANLRIDEHRVPQDGRIKIIIGGQNISIRVSTLPVMDGEKVVMRLLDESAKAATLDELGYKGQAFIAIERALKKPHGMLLVTGPTGSGKSTTLYSIISGLNDVGINISTVEDPVEYRIQGVNQTQVNSKVGMTFASGLRALLRQDPDVIMVGEVRDSETAEIAVHSALTGHVVLSTLHTNNAAGCLPRLLDMGIEPFLISSTVNAVIGQRLVRKLCQHCIEEYTPDEKIIEDIIENFGLRKEFLTSQKPIQPVAPKAGETKASNEQKIGERVIPVPEDIRLDKSSILDQIAADPEMVNRSAKEAEEIVLRNHIFLSEEEKAKPQKEAKSGTLHLTLYRSKGCNKCDNTGYSGRMGIYEVLEVDDEIGKLIIDHAQTDEIQSVAIKNGMITMQQDGFLKALEGITTVEEILRVTRE